MKPLGLDLGRISFEAVLVDGGGRTVGSMGADARDPGAAILFLYRHFTPRHEFPGAEGVA